MGVELTMKIKTFCGYFYNMLVGQWANGHLNVYTTRRSKIGENRIGEILTKRYSGYDGMTKTMMFFKC